MGCYIFSESCDQDILHTTHKHLILMIPGAVKIHLCQKLPHYRTSKFDNITYLIFLEVENCKFDIYILEHTCISLNLLTFPKYQEIETVLASIAELHRFWSVWMTFGNLCEASKPLYCDVVQAGLVLLKYSLILHNLVKWRSPQFKISVLSLLRQLSNKQKRMLSILHINFKP